METIIGLGNTGCNIAMKFMDYPQYKTICIDTEDKKYENFVKINRQASHEDYERNYTRLDLSGVAGSPTLIVGGSGFISGASLRILEQLDNKEVEIIYIHPDLETITEKGRTRDKITSQVLQQYTRSGVFKRIYLVDNTKVEDIVGDVSIKDYWDKMNEVIASTVYMTNVFSHIEPIMSTFSNVPASARISTLGIVDIDNGEEKLFYDLESPREKLYYYAINEEKTKEKSDLFKTIIGQVKSKSEERVRSSYSIYSTKYDDNYVYTTYHASMIQGENIS